MKKADSMKSIKDIESAKRIIPTLRKHARPTFTISETVVGVARVVFYINHHEPRYVTSEMDVSEAWRVCVELNMLAMQ